LENAQREVCYTWYLLILTIIEINTRSHDSWQVYFIAVFYLQFKISTRGVNYRYDLEFRFPFLLSWSIWFLFLFFFVAKSLVDIIHGILHDLVHVDERSNCNNCKQRDCDRDTWHYYFYFFTNKLSSILSIIILKLNEITFGFFIHTAILGCLNTWRVHTWTHFLFWCVTQFIHILQEVFVRLETSTSVLVG